MINKIITNRINLEIKGTVKLINKELWIVNYNLEAKIQGHIQINKIQHNINHKIILIQIFTIRKYNKIYKIILLIFRNKILNKHIKNH